MEPTEDYSKNVKPVAVKVRCNLDEIWFNVKQTVPKLTSAQKALAKVDKKGMKTMTSFFTKK